MNWRRFGGVFLFATVIHVGINIHLVGSMFGAAMRRKMGSPPTVADRVNRVALKIVVVPLAIPVLHGRGNFGLILLNSTTWGLAAAWLFRSREPTPGLCPRCGYDLRATPDRCPECGHVPHG